MIFEEYVAKLFLPFLTFFVTYILVKFVDYIFDSRIYDKRGTLIPGSRSNLYGKNFYSVVMEARRSKQATKALVDILLPTVGDGNICGSNLFGRRIVILAHPDYIKVVLNGSHTKFPKSVKYDRLKFFLGDGLVTSSGPKWQRHRMMISPGFHAEALKHMTGIFSLHTNERLKQWTTTIKESKQDTIKVDMYRDIVDLTLAVICDAGFGYTSKSGGIKPFFHDIGEEMNNKILDPFDWWPMLFPERVKRTKRAVDAVVGMIDDIITARVSKPKHDKPRDLLDILLHAREEGDTKLSPEELRDHSLTFLAAGHETTSTTLLWTFYELSRHPAIMKQCQDEIDSIFPKSTTDINLSTEDISKFVYIGQVFKESLRLHPPAQILARMTNDDVDIGKYRIPGGSILGICVLAVHRHQDFWDRPLEFLPDRFHPDNIKSTIKHPFQYIPFSSGPRNCIGARFATLEATAILILILRKFSIKIEPEDEAEIRFEETVTCGPRNMKAVLIPR